MLMHLKEESFKILLWIKKIPLFEWFIWKLKLFLLRQTKQIGAHSYIEYGAQVNKDCSLSGFNMISRGTVLQNIKMGKYSYASYNSNLSNADIGSFCSIGPNVKVGLGMHPVNTFVSSHPFFYSSQNPPLVPKVVDKSFFKELESVQIGNDVFIGANVIILDGIKIGDGAVIAAGSVVTKDVPSYSIAGGVPSEVIKYRFDENIIDFLNEFKWWNKDLNWLKENHNKFHNINEFVKEYHEK